jgi:hypothetical protein
MAVGLDQCGDCLADLAAQGPAPVAQLDRDGDLIQPHVARPGRPPAAGILSPVQRITVEGARFAHVAGAMDGESEARG